MYVTFACMDVYIYKYVLVYINVCDGQWIKTQQNLASEGQFMVYTCSKLHSPFSKSQSSNRVGAAGLALLGDTETSKWSKEDIIV